MVTFEALRQPDGDANPTCQAGFTGGRMRMRSRLKPGARNLPSEILCLDNQTGLSRMVAPAFLADVYNRDSQESCNDSRLRSRNRDQ